MKIPSPASNREVSVPRNNCTDESYCDYVIAPPLSYESFSIDSDLKPPPSSTPPPQSAPEGNTQATEGNFVPAEKTKPAMSRLELEETWIDPLSADVRDEDKSKGKFRPPSQQPTFQARAEGSHRETRAVWIVHGMGQQVKFESLDDLTHGLLDACGQNIKPRLRTVKLGREVLQRVELDIDGAKDGAGNVKHYELHLYESYWAPKTEGVAKLGDVISFLWDGGTRGLLNSMRDFSRAMFGGVAKFSVPFRTPLFLCIALLVVASLTVINGSVLTAATSRMFPAAFAPFDLYWCQLTALATCMLAVALSFGALLFLAQMTKPRGLSRRVSTTIAALCWIAMSCTIAVIVATAASMGILLRPGWLKGTNNVGCSAANPAQGCYVTVQGSTNWILAMLTRLWHWSIHIYGCVQHQLQTLPARQLQGFAVIIIILAIFIVCAAMFWRAILQSHETELSLSTFLLLLTGMAVALNAVAIVGCIAIWRGIPNGHLKFGALPDYLCFLQNPIWVWPFLISFSAAVRKVLVQFVGDVVIYVRANKLDRFDEVRNKIKEAARSVASAVYTAYEDTEERTAGHGLGSEKQRGMSRKFLYQNIAIVGHSLGSVIAYDTLNRLMLDDWLSKNKLRVPDRTRTLVTFGSPLNKTAFLFTIQVKDRLQIRERLAATVQPLIISYRKFRQLNWINVYSHNDIISGKLEFYDLPGFQDPLKP
jgi:hypothetical protein